MMTSVTGMIVRVGLFLMTGIKGKTRMARTMMMVRYKGDQQQKQDGRQYGKQAVSCFHTAKINRFFCNRVAKWLRAHILIAQLPYTDNVLNYSSAKTHKYMYKFCTDACLP